MSCKAMGLVFLAWWVGFACGELAVTLQSSAPDQPTHDGARPR